MLIIAKGVIEGAWTLIVGWVLPCAISLLLFRSLVLPSLGGDEMVITAIYGRLNEDGAPDGALLLLLAAVVLGWFLSALSTPLYQILEGYELWPRRIRDSRVRHYQRVRTARRERAESAVVGSLECVRAYEELYRYPLSDDQLLPTRLGNAIRSFECYGQDRYKLNAVRLWPHLMSSAPEALTREVNQARAGVDFFICLFYTQLMVSVAAILALIVQPGDWPKLIAASVIGIVVAIISYKAAITATGAWAAAVRAIVDLGRLPLAAAFGLDVPDSLDDERRMWEYLSWSLGYPYTPESAERMNQFRVRRTDAYFHDPLRADPSEPPRVQLH